MKYNPANPRGTIAIASALGGAWQHVVVLLLHLTGYESVSMQIKSFRQWGSKRQAIRSYDPGQGIEVTTGTAGPGDFQRRRYAIAQKYLANYFNRERLPIIDHKIYVIAGDGDLQEGVSSEASSLAGQPGPGESRGHLRRQSHQHRWQ